MEKIIISPTTHKYHINFHKMKIYLQLIFLKHSPIRPNVISLQSYLSNFSFQFLNLYLAQAHLSI